MLDFRTIFNVVNAAIPLILFFSALLMLCIAIPSIPKLKSYRTSRKTIAFAYFIFAVFSGINAIMNDPKPSETDMFVVAVITLIIASSQSFLFTYTLIILINPSFFSKRWIYRQLIPISIFSILSFTFLFFPANYFQKVVFYTFLAFYLYQLLFYTHTFVKEFKLYHLSAANYYSGDEAKHLNWIEIAFFSVLCIGVLAMALIIFPNPVFDVIVSILCCTFYACFLVKYINYPYVFNKVTILNEDPLVETNGDKFQDNLSQLLDQWIASKSYTEPEITIISLSKALNTNRTYLSAYINNTMQMNFNTWINSLRIEDAKKILKVSTNCSIADVAFQLGYADHSTFSRQFKKSTGLSPIEWKKKS